MAPDRRKNRIFSSNNEIQSNLWQVCAEQCKINGKAKLISAIYKIRIKES